MADLYGAAPSSAAGLASDSEEISNILNQLLHSSSSPYSSAACMSFKTKYMQVLHSPPPQPITSFSVSTLFGSEDRLRCHGSANPSELDCRLLDGNSVAGSSAVAESLSGFKISESGAYVGEETKEGPDNTISLAGVVDSDGNTFLKGRRISPENDLGDFSYDSEGLDASEEPSNPAPPRSSSKRSRAAEVHNLSEKRRRSRINEKMKALQNLIPNSNKTDKASMLDEAIEYLKQLQLQVQMLSMRNGLNLHPMCLPGVMHPMQLPLSQTGLGYNEGNKYLNSSRGLGPLSPSEERSMQSAYNLSNSSNISNQPTAIPSVTNITPLEAALVFEQSTQAHYRHFYLPTSSKEIITDGNSQLHLDTSHTGKVCSSDVDIVSSKRPDV